MPVNLISLNFSNFSQKFSKLLKNWIKKQINNNHQYNKKTNNNRNNKLTFNLKQTHFKKIINTSNKIYRLKKKISH